MAMDNNRPRGRKRRKVCAFCVDKVEHIDYKDAAKLKRFISERSKILPRSLCCPTSPTDWRHFFKLPRGRFGTTGSGAPPVFLRLFPGRLRLKE